MNTTTLRLALLFLSTALLFAGEAEEKASFKAYKEEVLQEPSLIRFYTFEEGDGIEVTNHVLLDPARTAQTGGTLGSLTIQTHVRGDAAVDETGVPMIPPSWTHGRWPWKAAVASGRDIAPYAWQVTKLFRSGITGEEFAEGMTVAAWVRIHENSAKEESAAILTLGSGYNDGFMLSYTKPAYNPRGAFQFRLGIGDNKTTPRADLTATPVPQGTWQHVAVTLDGKMASIYVNGQLIEQKPFSEKVVPTRYEDYPLVGPFFENNSPTRYGSFLMIAHNVPQEGKVTSQFDIGELAIYSRGLSAETIAKLAHDGSPGTTPDEQLAEYEAVAARRHLQDQIQLAIPTDTGGYFRIKQPVTATIDIPAETGLQGDFKAVLSLETLYGKPVNTIERAVRVGEPLTVDIQPPECGVYYLEMTVLSPDGSTLKRLAEPYCIAVVPPAPASLTEHNPLAIWADHAVRFYFDAPIRRMNYLGGGKSDFFQKHYDAYAARIPNFRAYVWFYGKIALTDEAKAYNQAMFEEAAQLMKDKPVFGVELTSEPHTDNIEAYVEMLRMATEAFRPVMPEIKFFPPGGAPPSIPMIANILKQGGIDYVDGVSYHPYTSNPIGTFLWDSNTDRLKKVVALYPEKKLTIWNTEGGVNSLPRIKGRPMTRKDAHAARFPASMLYGHQFFPYFIGQHPEDEAAALQCHAILLDLLQGYQIYTICQAPGIDGQPSLRGVAVTALAGQVLNTQTAVARLPLSTVENMCLLVKQTDGSTTAAVFSMQPATVNFQVAPNATYKTMDMLGNYGVMTANADGLLTLTIGKAPQYIFGVPDSLREVVPLTLTAPELLPENGILAAKLTVSNPFAQPLAGALVAPEIRGATVTMAKQQIQLAPGATETIDVQLKAEFLKRRSYLLGVELRDDAGKLISAAQTIFTSPGVIQMIPQLKTPVTLDGDGAEWADIPEAICDDADSVVHGKPNYAEMWVPQWANSDDLSFGVKTAWRKGDGIYFLLNVRDNVLLPAEGEQVGRAFKYDCLEFFFDSRDYAQQGTAITPGADQVVVVPQAAEQATPCTLWYARKGLNHIDLTCVGKRTANGYIIEGKITPNDRSSFRVQAGSQFRMDFLIDDSDSPEAKLLRKAAMALHGQFNNYNNSDIWGRYELSLDSK